MTTPTQRPPVPPEEQEPGPVRALVRLFLVQLLAVAAITVVLTTIAVLVGRDSSDTVSTVAKDPPSAARPSAGAASPTTPPVTPPPSSTPPSSTSPPSSRSQSSDPASPEVVVLNQSAGAGAAAEAADRLRRAGWTINRTADFSGTVRSTTVYYPDGEEQAARKAARALPGKTRILPRFSNLSRTRLTIVLTDDYPR